VIRTLIVDDDQHFSESLQIVIESRTDDMQVVGIAQDGVEAIRLCHRHKPDVILMDIRMPGMGGIDAAQVISQRFPEIRILMLTTFDEEAYVHESLGTGAVGYLLKGTRPDQLISSIRAVSDGVVTIEPSVAARLLNRARHDEQNDLERRFDISKLSRRERAVLTMLAAGSSNQDIATRLHLAEQTVKNYVSSIYFKLDLRGRNDLLLR
jgi:DNA-binding NarL/FixJ family response regulator